MRTTINFISWGIFLMLVYHMTETRTVTQTKDEPRVKYVQVKKEMKNRNPNS